MILCVNTKSIPASPAVQNDVDLGGILLKYTKYYETVEQAEKDSYAPLNFCMSVRSVYSNLVLEEHTEDGYKYYVNYTNIDKYIHKGYDLIMYLTSLGMLSYVNYKPEFDNLMVEHSTFQPVGLYNPNLGFCNPMIYCNVIIEDVAVESINQFLRPNVKWVPIDTIRLKSGGNISALLDRLIIIEKRS